MSGMLSDLSSRWEGHNIVFSRPSAFGNETGTLPNGEYIPSPEICASISTKKVLVIGAGGLGCELLKNLALSGVTDIHVIDLDTIDITNLNRQFLFRSADVGKGKAEVAAAFVMRRVPGCKVTPYNTKIQEFPMSFYVGFDIIIAGLDNVEARRWLNGMMCSIAFTEKDADGYSRCIPLIDGGSDGFKGQCRVILPTINACYECTSGLSTRDITFPVCTLAATPRSPEHCIAYAYLFMWNIAFPERKVDTDSPEDMNWIFEKALERSRAHNLEGEKEGDGVTYFKTLGFVKNVIPAVASTNSIIAASCCNEAIKLLTYAAQSLDNNFFMYGLENVSSSTVTYERNDHCMVCNDHTVPLSVAADITLKQLCDLLTDVDGKFKLKNPSLTSNDGVDCRPVTQRQLYIALPEVLRKHTVGNLDKTLGELGLGPGAVVVVTDRTLPQHLTIQLDILAE